MMAELAVSRKAVRDAQAKVRAVGSHLKEIDTLIAKSSVGYSFERIQSVERNVLRIGVYELLYAAEIPPKVAIATTGQTCRMRSPSFAKDHGAPPYCGE